MHRPRKARSCFELAGISRRSRRRKVVASALNAQKKQFPPRPPQPDPTTKCPRDCIVNLVNIPISVVRWQDAAQETLSIYNLASPPLFVCKVRKSASRFHIFSRTVGAGCPPRPRMFQQQHQTHVRGAQLSSSVKFTLSIASRCTIIKFCRLAWILTRSAKISRHLRCSLRPQLFSGYQEPLSSSNFSFANLACTEFQEAESMASVPLEKTLALNRSRNSTPPIETPGVPMGSHIRAGGCSWPTPVYYATPTPTTRSSIWSKWPTKLLPCITGTLYGLFSHGSAARDDRMPCEKHVHRQRVF